MCDLPKIVKIDYFDNIWGGTPKYGGGPPKYTFKKEYFGEGTLKFGGAPPNIFKIVYFLNF